MNFELLADSFRLSPIDSCEDEEKVARPCEGTLHTPSHKLEFQRIQLDLRDIRENDWKR